MADDILRKLRDWQDRLERSRDPNVARSVAAEVASAGLQCEFHEWTRLIAKLERDGVRDSTAALLASFTAERDNLGVLLKSLAESVGIDLRSFVAAIDRHAAAAAETERALELVMRRP